MTLQDAIKTGRPFRRSHWIMFAVVHEAGTIIVQGSRNGTVNFSSADIFAEDYEVCATTEIELLKELVAIKGVGIDELNDKLTALIRKTESFLMGDDFSHLLKTDVTDKIRNERFEGRQ